MIFMNSAVEMRKWRTFAAGACLIALSVFWAATALAQSYSYSRIEIEGNQRIDTASIIRFAGIPSSGVLTSDEMNQVYRRISDSGLFDEFSVAHRAGAIVISVVELPIINQISIEGNRALNDERLMELVQSKPRQVFVASDADLDAARIAEAYRTSGRFAATVVPKIIRRDFNRVDLVFEVFEGRVIETERIGFVGNRNYSDRRLRGVLASKQAKLLRAFIQRDTFISERLELDKSLLSDFYLSRGYIDFKVNSADAEMTRERDAFLVTFNIHEGTQFRFGEIAFTSSIPEIDPEVYGAESRIKSGDVYSPTYVNDAIQRMEALATDNGLQFVRARTEVSRNDSDSTLDITFNLERGPRVFVERIDIEGNTTTLDRVIRRQFDIVEGDPFNTREIAQAAERIRALGFFSTTDVTSREGSSPAQAIVDVRVEETPTGYLSFGASYAGDEGLAGTFSVTERNFLGRGQTLSFSFNTGSNNREYSIRFVEPNFLDRDVELSFASSYRTQTRFQQRFKSQEFKFTPSIRFPVSENGRLQLRTSANTYRISEFRSESPILRRDYARGNGDNISVGYTYEFDSRFTGLNPNRGYIFRVGQDVLVGRSGYNAIRTTTFAGAQTTAFGEEVTLTGIVEAGAVLATRGGTRIKDRFYSNSGVLRGFSTNGVGPRDVDANTNDALGGNYFAALHLESRMPIGLPSETGIMGGVFLDTGAVWGLDDVDGASRVDDSFFLRSSVGVSLFIDSFFGPLRLNYAWPIRKRDYDRTQSLDLTLASDF